jgi:hypothetical protein
MKKKRRREREKRGENIFTHDLKPADQKELT